MPKKELLKRAARVLGLGFGVPLVLLIGVAVFFGDSFIFFPSPYPAGYWEAHKHSPAPVEDVAFTAADGVKLHAWYAKVPNARATFLVCHGNAGNVTDRIHYIQSLQKLRASVFVFDYRGYGKSEGSPSESGVYADAEAAYRWLVDRGVPAGRIVPYGESLGGAVAVELAARVPVGGLILQCTFSSLHDMTGQVLPILPLGWFMRSKFASLAKVPKLQVPKLHFHGRPDTVVPCRLGRKLFDAAAEPKRWVEYPDLDHNDWPGRHEREWLSEIGRFLDEVLK
jgi:hypothetical protein